MPSDSMALGTRARRHVRLQLLGVVVFLAAVLVLVAGTGSGRAQEILPSVGPETVPGTGLMRYSHTWRLATNHDAYRYLIVGRNTARAATRRPGTSLVYHSGVGVTPDWDAGVPYAVAEANGWLLRDASGNYLKNLGYSYYTIADVGSAGYQAEWARRVGDYLASVGADGVFIDDVIGNISTTSGVFPVKYPTQAAWEDAMASFIRAVGATLKARGFYVLVNAWNWIENDGRSNDGTLIADWWRRLSPGVSGFHLEYFNQIHSDHSHRRGDGSAWYEQWLNHSRLIEVAQEGGRDFFGLTYGSTADVESMRYMRATFLLFWDGEGGGVIYQDEQGDPWNGEWTADLGLPAGARTPVGVGWRRPYEKGTVLVNPSTSKSQTFALRGAHLTSDGRRVRSAVLPPRSGLILRWASGRRAASGPRGSNSSHENPLPSDRSIETLEQHRLERARSS